MTLTVIFMGTPHFAVPTLRALHAAGHGIARVVTAPPKPAGRGMAPRRSPVHEQAEGLGLSVLTPRSLRDPALVEEFEGLGADVGVVVAYGLLIPPAVLSIPRHGFLNLHPSLLPRWRGAAPLNRTLMAGDTQTGVMVMRMEEGLDTGPVGPGISIAVPEDMTAGALHDRLAELGAGLMVRALSLLEEGTLAFTPQSTEGVTYAAKLTNEESRIDWSMPARALHDKVRGLSPFPGAWFMADLGKGPERVKLLRACLAEGEGPPGTVLDHDGRIACGRGAIQLLTVQRAGAKSMDFVAFARGARLDSGAVFF